MRAATLILLIPLSCTRRTAQPVTPAPDAIGGGPPIGVVNTGQARTAIARARCASVAACEGVELDPCITREEATIPGLPCVSLVRERLNACVEATRARTCTNPTTPEECAPEELCSKEEPR